MKTLFMLAAAATALVGGANADVCSRVTLLTLFRDANYTPCSSQSGYSFILGVKPTVDEANVMCRVPACKALLANAPGLGLSECTMPNGPGIFLFADVIDFVDGICKEGDSPEPTPTATPTATPTPTPTETVEPTLPPHDSC